MNLTWQWPWIGLSALLAAVAAIVAMAIIDARRTAKGPVARSFSLDDDLSTERASALLRRWRAMGRLALVLLTAALIVSLALVARPSQVNADDERSSSRDIVLCLDVSGSTLPYDREVIDTYVDLVNSFRGERIGLSIFNSTSRTVFPLTDDYGVILDQLKSASAILEGVQSQDDIDKMSDQQYQQISDWLEGTQNRKNATSLIGDGLVSCAAMLPGFTYGDAASGNTDANAADAGSARRRRAASIILATDNVVSGTPTYTLGQALDLVRQADISVNGMYAGPRQNAGDAATTQMRSEIESHDGSFYAQSDNASIATLVRDIERRSKSSDQSANQAAFVDAPGWWSAALAVLVAAWLILAWRLRR